METLAYLLNDMKLAETNENLETVTILIAKGDPCCHKIVNSL